MCFARRCGSYAPLRFSLGLPGRGRRSPRRLLSSRFRDQTGPLSGPQNRRPPVLPRRNHRRPATHPRKGRRSFPSLAKRRCRRLRLLPPPRPRSLQRHRSRRSSWSGRTPACPRHRWLFQQATESPQARRRGTERLRFPSAGPGCDVAAGSRGAPWRRGSASSFAGELG